MSKGRKATMKKFRSGNIENYNGNRKEESRVSFTFRVSQFGS